MAHDFRKFPELTNSQMDIYYFDSPHEQIFENFTAKVVKVTDGDTIRVLWDRRDFDFPVRLMDINALEMGEGGEESQSWLERQILGKDVEILINPDRRVEKWGRLLGYVMLKGVDVGNESVREGMSKPWALRGDGLIPGLERQLRGSEIQ